MFPTSTAVSSCATAGRWPGHVWEAPKDRPVVRLQGYCFVTHRPRPNPLPAHARMIVVDRPGFGHSTPPPWPWTAVKSPTTSSSSSMS